MDSDENLSEELERLRGELSELHGRLSVIENELNIEQSQTESAQAREEDEPFTKDLDEAPSEGEERTAVGDVPSEELAQHSPKPSQSESFSTRFLSDTSTASWLGWIGTLALVVGVVLFIRYAIERDLIGYLDRVLLGIAGGCALIAVGWFVRRYRGYELWAQTVMGGGIAITYFSIYAAYGFETYREAIGVSLGVTVALLTVVVIGAVGLAIGLDSRVIATEAFLLGFVTAVLGVELGMLTLIYVLLLAAGLVVVCTARPWIELAVGGVFGTYGVYILWLAESTDPFATGAPFLIVAFVLYLSASLLHAGDRSDTEIRGRSMVSVLTVSNALIFAFLFDLLLLDWYPAYRPVLYVALTACFAGFYPLSEYTTTRSFPAPYLSVTFLVAAISVQFSLYWISVLSAVLVPLLILLAFHIDLPDLRYAAYGVTGFVAGKLLLFDAWELPAGSFSEPFVAARPWPFLVAVIAFALTHRLLARRRESLSTLEQGWLVSAPTGYVWLASSLCVVLLGLELDGYSVSVAWAVLGLGLLVAGLRLGRPELREQSLILLGVTIIKVFLYDTSDLDALPRTLSFLTLGVILLVAAYIYTQYLRDTTRDQGTEKVL